LPETPGSVFRQDSAVCRLLPGLTKRQRDTCGRHRTAIGHVVKGLKAAVHECQNQFQDQRWNCSASHNGFAIAHLKVGSKETAYVFALSSAAVSRTLARACAQGVIASCSCGSYPKRIHKQFKWTGCSDNIKYANNFGRKFMDAADLDHADDARSMMNLHNNRVGRKAVSSSARRECKCHGVSGSCVLRTCWKVVPQLQEIAVSLRKKYFHAAKVFPR
uniref:Protein Wnt n=1 Tax=Gongylonema pulchrum TaxID=637853 RepID=A0A183ENC8_9BILA